jgi:SAM-dependent methyltransferase
MNFRDHIRNEILKTDDRILEFGPLNWPVVQKSQFNNAMYADIRSTDDIKKLYTSNDYLKATGISIDIESIVDIDFVITDSYVGAFSNIKKFDAVILSHVIEHIPDIIDFFKDVSKIIKKDGKLIILYPDARYCFDHFRNGTTFIDAYEVYKNKAKNASSVFDFTFNVINENNPKFFWNSTKLPEKLPKNDFNKSLEAHKKAQKGTMPDDVHFWPFSDYQFIKFLYDMERARLLDFNISEFRATQRDTQEFMAILSLKDKKTTTNYADILSGVSPQIKLTKSYDKILALEDEVRGVKSKNERLNTEIAGIYNSIRYRFINKVINLINKILFFRK